MLGEVGSDKCEINMRNRKLRIHIVTFSAEISEYNSMDYIILITTRDYNQIWFLFVDFVVRTNGKHTAWMGPAHVLLMKCISSDRQLGRQFLHVFAPSNQRKKKTFFGRCARLSYSNQISRAGVIHTQHSVGLHRCWQLPHPTRVHLCCYVGCSCSCRIGVASVFRITKFQQKFKWKLYI